MEYRKKQRPLKIRMLDGTVKTIMVDDSKTVTDMLMTICARIGITNHDEYSLVRELMEEKKDEGTGTLRKDKTLLRDEKKEGTTPALPLDPGQILGHPAGMW